MQRNKSLHPIFKNYYYISVLTGGGLKYNLIRLERMKNTKINIVGTTVTQNAFNNEKN